MRILEKTLLVLIVLGILLKTIPVAGAGIITTIAIMSLSFLYFYFGFAVFTNLGFRKAFKRSSYAILQKRDIAFSIASGICLTILLLGILFKLQYWLGSGVMVLEGMIFTSIVATIAIVSLKSKNGFIYKMILFRAIPMLLLGMFLYVTPVQSRLKIFKVPSHEIEQQILKYNK